MQKGTFSMRLSNKDKYAISGMLAEGKTNKQIAKKLNLDLTAVENYISKQEKIVDDITKVEVAKGSSAKDTSATVVKKVRKRLLAKGFSERDADNLITSALKSAEKNNVGFTSEDDLYTAALKRINAASLMVKRGQDGRSGVCIMTGAASERIDSSKSKKKTGLGRYSRGNLYDTSGNKLTNDKETDEKK